MWLKFELLVVEVVVEEEALDVDGCGRCFCV
jgi:hypothetical protein